jgi:hypothetical protein
VKRNVDCEVFQDQLDGLLEGTLAEDVVGQLRRHASSCPDCRALLDLEERLAASSRAGLEAVVPEEYVTTMWGRVRADIASQGARRGSRWGVRPVSGWLVPGLAAAALLLLLVTGLLARELKRLQAREQVLAQQVADHERWLTELDTRTREDPIARTAALAGSQVWGRLLSRRESVSVAELEALLASLPSRATVLSLEEWQGLERAVPLGMRSVWAGAASAVESEDGVQAAELLALLDALDLEPGRSVSTARILALRGAVGSGSL